MGNMQWKYPQLASLRWESQDSLRLIEDLADTQALQDVQERMQRHKERMEEDEAALIRWVKREAGRT